MFLDPSDFFLVMSLCSKILDVNLVSTMLFLLTKMMARTIKLRPKLHFNAYDNTFLESCVYCMCVDDQN